MFIVVYNDGDMVWNTPYGWSDECKGAIVSSDNEVAMFDSRADARTAIKISERYANLCEAQGSSVNTDFTEGKRFIKILPLAKKPGAAR